MAKPRFGDGQAPLQRTTASAALAPNAVDMKRLSNRKSARLANFLTALDPVEGRDERRCCRRAVCASHAVVAPRSRVEREDESISICVPEQ